MLSSICSSIAQKNDRDIILGILDKQTQAWNRGDLDNFMVGYWNNDSLMYVGKGGITYGYQRTLENYRKNYGDRARMGKLTFTIIHVNRHARNLFQVVGKWHLERTIGDAGGHFTLLFKKIDGEWVIIADHSS